MAILEAEDEMKDGKIKVLGIICLMILAVIAIGNLGVADNSDYLRIHIRADSNSSFDQQVKYEVKDAIVAYLTPMLSSCDTIEKVREKVAEEMENIIDVANNVLSENTVNYRASASLTVETFPTRSYDGLVLQEGSYESLIVNLGSGDGDNWWCVLYPPLCFVPEEGEGGNVVYRSKILDIIANFKEE